MEKWILENKDWVVPLSVALLSLVGAALGGWWAGRKRIGIEVLSKNRQEWINDIRHVICDFIDIAISSATKYVENLDYQEFSNQARKLDHKRHYLALLLNPNEDNSIKINELAYAIVERHALLISLIGINKKISDKQKVQDTINLLISNTNELVAITQKVLKTEWERVKKGV